MVEFLSAGHSLAYADFQWISLIQYIGAHIGQNTGPAFPVKLLSHITEFSPKFSTAYEWAMWVLPIPNTIELSYSEEQKKNLQPSLKVAYKGIQELCAREKIDTILQTPLNNTLWGQENLKNPCKSDMLAYLIAFYEGQLGGNSEVAKNFYKIAGMQEGAPSVSQFLAIIAASSKNDHRTTATNFSLNALGGYDTKDEMCRNLAEKNIITLQSEKIPLKNILEIIKLEKELTKPDDSETLGMQTCFDMLERGIKYTYLAFIQEESKDFPEITKIEELLPKI